MRDEIPAALGSVGPNGEWAGDGEMGWTWAEMGVNGRNIGREREDVDKNGQNKHEEGMLERMGPMVRYGE